jgi:aspartyl-tRNA(Asn)/glutamyl-tRNA(Gln) amidotransferase subunit B
MPIAPQARSLEQIAHVRLVVGMEVHVELATTTKLFTRVPNPAAPRADHHHASPNTLIDPVVLALPGALPVMNREAVELSMLVGLALRCRIARFSKWDRKSYFYPDLPKAYQISQYDLPICADGVVEVPASDEKGFPDPTQPAARIGIIRAHLEEDAGKLLHEAPGGRVIDFSIADYNRAGTPLLEIVTQPDFTSSAQCVMFAKLLRATCRLLGATRGVMQEGHMRFEPNINCVLTLRDGTLVKTPIVEVKNLNSFRSLQGAIDFELEEQPRRWVQDGREFGPGSKVTRGWDDASESTFVQREKEDAHDYRYFPDPDLPPVRVDDAWMSRVQARMVEGPLERWRWYVGEYAIPAKEAFALIDEPATCLFYESVIDACVELGVERARAGKIAANLVLQQLQRRANERAAADAPAGVQDIGLHPRTAASVASLREAGELNNYSIESLLDALIGAPRDHGATTTQDARAERDRVRALAATLGLLVVRDDAQAGQWIDHVLAAHPRVAEDVRAGKLAAAGRLVGEVMKLAAGKADAKSVRAMLLAKLGVRE